MKEQRYVVHYSGQVQGVGFRYAVCRLSSSFAVRGFVRNMSDGQVQITAEGSAQQLDHFLQAVRDEMAGYIRTENLQRKQATGEFSSFGLQF